MRILIANRGEIACRIVRTARLRGDETVAAYADPDRDTPFVAEATTSARIGPAELAESYLSIERLLAAAKKTDADAIHPGYGFLSENAGFAQAVLDAGLLWIGPHPEAIRSMGSKIEARRLARAAGVPVIPGYDESQDPSDLERAADHIGYPVLVKAAAGGGGKGIRIVHERAEFAGELALARAEAERAFGDDAMIVERFVERPRHVEVQIVGDRHGHVIDLGTRECSVQRRYQKLLEEAPAPRLSDETREGLQRRAVELARSIGYDSTGTVEFVLDDESGDYFFLEMNTRLQVEHPVTEAVTGLDLVDLQLRVARGEPLPIEQAEVRIEGHAIEARINAEDPTAGFAPGTGRIGPLRVPEGIRWDAGVVTGSLISSHYDPMIAKLIVRGADREEARRRLAAALDDLVIGGLPTNTGFHRWLIDQPPFVAGRITTRFLDETTPTTEVDRERAATIAARAWTAARDRARERDAWHALIGFRVTPHRTSRMLALEDHRGGFWEVAVPDSPGTLDTHLLWEEGDRRHRSTACVELEERSVAVNLAGETHSFRIRSRSEHWAPIESEGHGPSDAVRAPFPAVVQEVRVAEGDKVEAGDVVAVLEAMKMLHSLTAGAAAVVAEVRISVGDSVDARAVLVTFEPPADPAHE